MKTKEINLYNINELKEINKSAYDDVIEKHSQFLIDSRFEYDALDDCYSILLEKYNIKKDIINDIYYSISYCQGDGVCFTASNILSYTRLTKKHDLNVFEKWIADNLSDTDMQLLIEYLNCGYNLNIKKISHNYCHAHTCKIDYESFYSSDDYKYIDKMDSFIYGLCNKLFDNVYLDICGDLEKKLYSYYDISGDDVIADIISNDYYYTIDGELE